MLLYLMYISEAGVDTMNALKERRSRASSGGTGNAEATQFRQKMIPIQEKIFLSKKGLQLLCPKKD